MMQLHEFRFLPDEACFLSPEDSKALNLLINSHKGAPGFFEFKLLEKEKAFPKEHFFFKAEQINAALDSIDVSQKEENINSEINLGIEKMTLQENLIDQRDAMNQEITRKIELDEPHPDDFPLEIEEPKGVLYSLENTIFDEEKTLQEGRRFVGLEIEEKPASPIGKACFNRAVMKRRMINEDPKEDLKKIQQSLSLLSFANDLD